MNSDDFDHAMRARLRALPVPPVPETWLAHRPRRIAVFALLAAVAVAALLTVHAAPPRLVQEAWLHAAEERDLRGELVPNLDAVRARLGLPAHAPLPGTVQLVKLCQVDGRLAYHLSLYVENRGYVTVIAFPDELSLSRPRGAFFVQHWDALRGPQGTVLLLATDARALDAIKAGLGFKA